MPSLKNNNTMADLGVITSRTHKVDKGVCLAKVPRGWFVFVSRVLSSFAVGEGLVLTRTMTGDKWRIDLNRGAWTCPFFTRVWLDSTVTPAKWRYNIGQGYITAGFKAKYDWLGTTDVEIGSVGSLSASTKYFIWITVAVDPDDGYFTASYKPVDGGLTTGATYGDKAKAGYMIASFLTDASGDPIPGSVRQERASTIHAPVLALLYTSVYVGYACSHTATLQTFDMAPDHPALVWYEPNPTYADSTTQVTSG